MRFEERELKPYAEPVTASELKEGEVYFAVNNVDNKMLIPTMETVVFAGRNLDPDDVGKVYFQDIDSYLQGIRHDSTLEDDRIMLSCGSENETKHIFTFENALNELMKCALRRRKAQSTG